MGTAFSTILTRFAMQEIDDINWTREIAANPARFFRAKSDTLIMAIPRFSRPPEMQKWLSFTPPDYDDFLYTAEEEQEGPITVETGKDGYELCCAVMAGTEQTVPCTYDTETGDVTLQTDLEAGQSVGIDFYTDGVFDNELDVEQCHILGLCVAYQWFSRFSNTWLNMTPKIKDKSFDIGSESAQMTATTAKRKVTKADLDDALLRYEQNKAYLKNMPTGSQFVPP